MFAHGQPVEGDLLLAQLARVVHEHKTCVAELLLVLLDGGAVVLHDVLVEGARVGRYRGAADLTGPGALVVPLHLVLGVRGAGGLRRSCRVLGAEEAIVLVSDRLGRAALLVHRRVPLKGHLVGLLHVFGDADARPGERLEADLALVLPDVDPCPPVLPEVCELV